MMKTLATALALALTATTAPAQNSTAQPETGAASEQTDPGVRTLGDLTLTGAYARATLPNAPVGGGFLTIANGGGADDRLLAVSTPAAARAEIHEMAMTDGVMTMRPLPDGLPIPAGETVELKPGGYHLMFMELTDRLIEGQTLPVTLTFETAGTVTVPLAIGAPNAKGAHGHAGHADHPGPSGHAMPKE